MRKKQRSKGKTVRTGQPKKKKAGEQRGRTLLLLGREERAKLREEQALGARKQVYFSLPATYVYRLNMAAEAEERSSASYLKVLIASSLREIREGKRLRPWPRVSEIPQPEVVVYTRLRPLDKERVARYARDRRMTLANALRTLVSAEFDQRPSA